MRLMKRDETMQNMNYYYDFSGQKFEYPLSLSINQFDRQVFSKTIFFRNFLCFKKEIMKLLQKKCRLLFINMN